MLVIELRLVSWEIKCRFSRCWKGAYTTLQTTLLSHEVSTRSIKKESDEEKQILLVFFSNIIIEVLKTKPNFYTRNFDTFLVSPTLLYITLDTKLIFNFSLTFILFVYI